MNRSVLSVSGLSKKFGTFWANRNISLEIENGSIHAIVGENGAGKSTLTRMLYGLLSPTSGFISVRGKSVRFSSPRQAIAEGIGMVHQHFMLVPELTVTENIMLGDERSHLFAPLKKRGTSETIRKIADTHALSIDPDALVSDLSVGEEQRVEILKLLYRNADILILDEPTAVLTPLETEKLFATLKSLQKEGKTVILITHKLDEVISVSDRVSVMRRGELIATEPTPSVTKADLARLMVGRDVLLRVEHPEENIGRPVLEVSNLSMNDWKGVQRLNGLSFEIRAGEIYGIAGVEGNGQSELLASLWGIADRRSVIDGSVMLDGTSIKGLHADKIAAMGVSHIPEDRLKHAVVPDFTIAENLIFGRHREKKFARTGGFNIPAIREYTDTVISEYMIRHNDRDNQKLASLSGGNQQKVVLAREIRRPDLKLLLLAQPTRGVDIGAIEMIHRQIIETRDKGIAILLVSAELDELVSLSTRIGCLYKGSLRREFTAEEVRYGRSSEKDFKKEIGLSIT